jgi:hypothetical protein
MHCYSLLHTAHSVLEIVKLYRQLAVAFIVVVVPIVLSGNEATTFL